MRNKTTPLLSKGGEFCFYFYKYAMRRCGRSPQRIFDKEKSERKELDLGFLGLELKNR